jgi:hypothetical protein
LISQLPIDRVITPYPNENEQDAQLRYLNTIADIDTNKIKTDKEEFEERYSKLKNKGK